MKKIVFLLSLAIIIVWGGCQKQTSAEIISPEGGEAVLNESPDFVDFADGKFPTGWITYTWEIDNHIGHNDNYSLKAANYPVALVFTKKTMVDSAYIEFYTYGDDIDFFIDGVKAETSFSTPEGNWTKWMYEFEKGTHEFKWQAVGISSYLDDIRFDFKIVDETELSF